jgi:hypothetical protein
VRNLRRHYSHFFQNENESLERRGALSLIPGWHRVREGSTNLLTGRSLSATTEFFLGDYFCSLEKGNLFLQHAKGLRLVTSHKILFQKLIQRNNFSSMAFVLLNFHCCNHTREKRDCSARGLKVMLYLHFPLHN